MIKVLCVIGTRPEAIKMIPVIYALRQNPMFNCRIIATAQHREMLDQVFDLFGIISDIDLDIMQPNQSLNTLAGRMLLALEQVILHEKPQAILAQGDTTTVFTAALSAFHHRIPFGHVEAGLRTHDKYTPFPEEMNRLLTSNIAEWHFAPTTIAKQNLLAEGIAEKNIFSTGNTIVDMVRIVTSNPIQSTINVSQTKKTILVTAHRRENFGAPLREIFKAIRVLADTRDDIEIIYPVHPNPNVQSVANEMLRFHSNITLCEPQNYISFVDLMKKAYFIMSDSGGIQEEAISLGKPLLLLREQTERPEGVELGGVIKVGHHYDSILLHANKLLDDVNYYNQTSTCASPYGDGYAANKICQILTTYFTEQSMQVNSNS